MATVAASACRGRRQTPVQIRISTAAPPSDFLTKALNQLKADVDKAAVGLDVSVHPASTLFKQGTEVPALQRGNLEMSTMTTFEVAQQIPQLGYFNRGYLLRDYDQMRRVFDGPIGDDYRNTVADKMGIEILATHYLGTRQVNLAPEAQRQDAGRSRRRQDAHARRSGMAAARRTLGVTPVPMGMPEVYLALKTGTVDGQENPLSILNAAKFYEVSEQVVLTAHMVQPVFFNIAKPVWDKLNADQKKVLSDACSHGGKRRRRRAARRRKGDRDGTEGMRALRSTPSISHRSARRRSCLCQIRSRQGMGRCRRCSARMKA